MAEIKITELNELNLADLNNNDVLPIVDVSEDETKKIRVANMKPTVNNSYSTSQIEPYSANYINIHTKPVVLYTNDSGTVSQIILSETAANFTYIIIQAKDNTGYFYQDTVVYEPNGKIVDIDKTYERYTKMGQITINANQINFNFNEQYNSATQRIDTGNFCLITKVIGFRN